VLITVLLLILGLSCLVFGADWFVKGAAGLADAFGVSPLVIGLTVVAYGTSMPELVVSAVAALDGKSAIALGNVVGSNIANIGLILALTALISPPNVDGGLIKREIPILVVSAALVPLALRNGVLSRVEGIVLLLGAIAFTIATVRYSKTAPAGDLMVSETISETVTEIAESKATSSTLRLVLIGLAGLALLLQGGRWFVGAAVTIAEAAGISERVIGLTVVAVGTSLPELAASVVAAVRGHSAMAVGNVIGSNIFNVFFVLGVTGVLSPIVGDLSELKVDLALMVGFSVLAALMLRGERVISRAEGAVMLTGYIAAILFLSGASV
jgi:cation:H+ antiporter